MKHNEDKNILLSMSIIKKIILKHKFMGMYIAPIWIRGLNINVFKGEGVLLMPREEIVLRIEAIVFPTKYYYNQLHI